MLAISIPRAGRIAILGTSLVQQNHNGSDSHIATSARGWMSWAEVLSHGRLACPVHHDPAVIPGWEPSNRPGISRFFTGLNFGVSGQKAIEIERRVARLLAEDFDLIIVDAGTNDMMVETKETIAEIRARIATPLLAAGKTVILLPILARGTQKWPSGGAERAKAHWINQMSSDFAARHANCHVFDWNTPQVDTADPDGAPLAGLSNDGTHFSVTGGFAVGKALAAYLTPLVPHTAPVWWRPTTASTPSTTRSATSPAPKTSWSAQQPAQTTFWPTTSSIPAPVHGSQPAAPSPSPPIPPFWASRSS
ncbi:SGNH/GDSL hydrolase family protein [Devosia sp. A8/3-2]|nr:SGNH/GDSL hydrolase family protein [Devosia sp. A8/3-2]